MSEELAREIEAGRGTDEAVALALGFKEQMFFCGYGGESFDWVAPDGTRHPRCPAFRSDLNALAAECERRGWRATGTVGASTQTNGHGFILSKDNTLATTPFFKGHAPTPARALCAALVRAAGETR